MKISTMMNWNMKEDFGTGLLEWLYDESVDVDDIIFYRDLPAQAQIAVLDIIQKQIIEAIKNEKKILELKVN